MSFIHQIDPVAFYVFNWPIKWYALSYLFSFCYAFFVFSKSNLVKDQTLQQKLDILVDIFWGIILGGRLGYVLLYDPLYYLFSPLKIFFLWDGGMAFHGGLLGLLVAVHFISKRYRLSAWGLLDQAALIAPVGIGVGRLTNFINAELIGRRSDVYWSVVFPTVDAFSHHPSQIYEALGEGLLLWLVLSFVHARYAHWSSTEGRISILFLTLYATIRFFLEFFREPDAHIGMILTYFTWGQSLCLMCLLCLGLYFVYGHWKKYGLKETVCV